MEIFWNLKPIAATFSHYKFGSIMDGYNCFNESFIYIGP